MSAVASDWFERAGSRGGCWVRDTAADGTSNLWVCQRGLLQEKGPVCVSGARGGVSG